MSMIIVRENFMIYKLESKTLKVFLPQTLLVSVYSSKLICFVSTYSLKGG